MRLTSIDTKLITSLGIHHDTDYVFYIRIPEGYSDDTWESICNAYMQELKNGGNVRDERVLDDNLIQIRNTQTVFVQFAWFEIVFIDVAEGYYSFGIKLKDSDIKNYIIDALYDSKMSVKVKPYVIGGCGKKSQLCYFTVVIS